MSDCMPPASAQPAEGEAVIGADALKPRQDDSGRRQDGVREEGKADRDDDDHDEGLHAPRGAEEAVPRCDVHGSPSSCLCGGGTASAEDGEARGGGYSAALIWPFT